MEKKTKIDIPIKPCRMQIGVIYIIHYTLYIIELQSPEEYKIVQQYSRESKPIQH